MNVPSAKVEMNMEIAYARYLEIAMNGMNRTRMSFLKRLAEKGGGCFMIKDQSECPYFLILENDSNFETFCSSLNPGDVIAAEYFSPQITLDGLIDFMPGALAFSAVSTAGKVHKFRT